MQLFRRTKRRHTRISKIKHILRVSHLKNENSIEEAKQIDKKKQKTEIKFPWWCKVFAYILSFAFAGVSLFFVIVKGIEFGDEKVQKWLTSLLISFFTSLLLTQPLQVTAFFVF